MSMQTATILGELPEPSRERAEALSASYLTLAKGNPAEALRLLALHSLEDQAEYDRALRWYVSRGYVQGALDRAMPPQHA